MAEHKIALSFDVEDWYHTPVITGYTFSMYKTVDEFFSNWQGRYDYLTQAVLNNLALLEEKQVKATFFVVADLLKRYPEVAQALKNSPHEIACHSLHHQIPLNPKTNELIQSQSEWEKDLVESKRLLEEFFGRPIIGYRAPGAYFADWMVDILIRCGFKYDSSVAYNSFYNKTNVKLNNIITRPYKINAATLGHQGPVTPLLELPWSYYSMGGVNLPAGGAFFYRLLGNTYFKAALSQCLQKGDTSFYMHPLDFAEEAFPMHNHWKRPLYWVNKGRTSLNRMGKLIDSFKGQWATCEEVYLNFSNS